MGNLALKDKSTEKILAEIKSEKNHKKRIAMMLRLIPENTFDKNTVTIADLGVEMHLVILLKAIDEAIFKDTVNIQMLKTLVTEIGKLSTKNVNINVDIHYKMAAKDVDNMEREDIREKIGSHYAQLDEGMFPVADMENADFKEVE